MLKNAKKIDLEEMVFRRQLTCDEIIDMLDLKYIPTKRTEHSIHPGIYEKTDLNKSLEYILPTKVKVNFTIDDIRLKSNLNNNQTLIFTKSFFSKLI